MILRTIRDVSFLEHSVVWLSTPDLLSGNFRVLWEANLLSLIFGGLISVTTRFPELPRQKTELEESPRSVPEV